MLLEVTFNLDIELKKLITYVPIKHEISCL